MFKYPDSPGIQFYLTEQLRKRFELEEIEFFLPQLCHFMITQERANMALESFLIECCKESTHFALLMYWNLEAYKMELKYKNNSFAFKTCDRVHSKCRSIILSQTEGSSEDIPKQILNIHLYPSVVALGMIWGAMASPNVVDHSLRMAMQESEAPVNQPVSRKMSKAEASNIAPQMSGRRSFSLFSPKQRLDGQGPSHSPSLEELFTGDAFSLNRYVAKTLSTKSMLSESTVPSQESSNKDSLLRKEVQRVDSNLQSLDLSMHSDNNSVDLANPHYFYSELTFIGALNEISRRLLLLPKEDRQTSLRGELSLLNHNLPARVCIPLWCSATKSEPYHHMVVRIVVSEGVVLNSAEKAPYFLLVEVLETNANDAEALDPSQFAKNPLENISEYDMASMRNFEFSTANNSTTTTLVSNESYNEDFGMKKVARDPDLIEKLPSPSPFDAFGASDDFNPRMRTAAIMLAQLFDSKTDIKPLMKEQIRFKILQEMTRLEEDRMKTVIRQRMEHETNRRIREQEQSVGDELIINEKRGILGDRIMETLKEDPSGSVFREPWSVKRERVRKSSPYGHMDNWNLFSVIVKTGSDLRQEQLACQLIREMKSIWKIEHVDIINNSYRVLITSHASGLIETISNAISIHSIKKDAYAKGYVPHGSLYNLRDYFIKEFGPVGSDRFRLAQMNFIQSLAAYSLITYILAIKDRHNGNILLDNDGHIIHIDFGFMIYNTPGSVGFESAPFKLSQEYVDIIDGVNSPLFDLFKDLLLKAFLALRKHADKIILLIEMMQKGKYN